MSKVYVDTSALAKWYISEAYSEEFAQWIQQQDEVYISSLTVLEFHCILGRRSRNGEFNPQQIADILQTIQSDIDGGYLLKYQINDQHIVDAIKLIDKLTDIPLRALDAIHLSIAQHIEVKTIATADKVMITAAEQRGFVVTKFC